MENKFKRVPFDIELAKDIQSGKVEGRIVTDKGAPARILCYDFKCGEYSIGAAISVRDGERFCCITNSGLRSTGEQINDGWFDKLLIELPEEAPKQMTLGQCKKGDEVWIFSNYDYGTEYVKVKVGKFSLNTSSGKRRNVTFENGFTCQELTSKTCWYENPKETPNHILKNEKVLYKQYKNSSILLDKILKAIGNDFDEKEKESFKIVKKYLDDIISMQSNRLEETPKHEFKPFDRVLMKNVNTNWYPTIFSNKESTGFRNIGGELFAYCIPYESNEHLIGTTDNPD